MTPEQQEYILSAMGIEQWTLRDNPNHTEVDANIADATIDVDIKISNCRACALGCASPFGGTLLGADAGSETATLLVISEHINQDNLPFSAKSQNLFTKMMVAINQNSIFLTTAVKCPSQTKAELANAKICRQYLAPQIEKIQPRAILTLGTVASQSLFNQDKTISQIRELQANQPAEINGIPVVSTFHPECLLHQPSQKSLVWQDLLRLADLLEQ